MKFIVEHATFERAVKKVLFATNERHRMQILTHVAMKATEDGGLLLEGTDLDIGIKVRVPAEVIEEGSTTISGKKLKNICYFSNGEMTFSENNNKVLVKASGSKYSITGMEYTDFPLLPEVEGKKIVIKQSVLKNLMLKTNHASAKNDIRPALCGILFELLDTSLSLAATDGNRLSLFDYPLGFVTDKASVIIPHRNIDGIASLLSNSGEDVEITLGKDKIKFEMQDVEITSTLIDAQFPSFRRIIPTSSKIHFEIGRSPLIASIQKTIFVDDDKVKKVIISLSENNILISAEKNGEEAEDSKDIVYHGNPIKIGFNSSYLLDALLSISDDVVDLYLNSENESILIVSDKGQHQQVIMPLRL